MTNFEIIILITIYMFCYGYTVEMFIKEKNVWLRIFIIIISLAFAIYAPLVISSDLYHKLNKK